MSDSPKQKTPEWRDELRRIRDRWRTFTASVRRFRQAIKDRPR